MNEFEIGYTPENLKKIRAKYGLKQMDVARITNTKTQGSVTNWEASIDKICHMDMPHKKWIMLLEYLNIKNINDI